MNEGYLRQRRNLISISILLLIAMLGGMTENPLYPFHLDRPYMAQLFMWVGFGYFWYRVKVYQPVSLFQEFKTEILLSYIFKYSRSEYEYYNLSTFTGLITTGGKDQNQDMTLFQMSGTSNVVGNGRADKIQVPVKYEEILNKRDYFRNIISGKVATDFYLPHIIAATALVVGSFNSFIAF